MAKPGRTTALAGYLCSWLCGLCWQLAMRIMPVVGYAHYVDNTRIATAAKVLVQSKNLFRLNGSLGLCLDDANTLQHLPLPGGLLRVVRRCNVQYSGSQPIKGSTGVGSPSVGNITHIEQQRLGVEQKRLQNEQELNKVLILYWLEWLRKSYHAILSL